MRIADLSEIAASCGVTTTHLARVFRRFGNTTPQNYLTTRKMRFAADLIRRSDATLDAIAATIGYADAFAFSKAFKRIMGRRPSELRP